METRQVDRQEAAAHPVEGARLRLLRLLAFVVVPGLFVALIALGLVTTGPKVVAGTAAPEFELQELGGGATITSAQLKGAPVVVNFWASWCIPCREEAPTLERAWQRYRDRGVRFLGVNVQDAEEDALAFVEEFSITYPSVRDVDGTLTRRFGVRGVPETFFIDHRWRFFSVGAGEQVGARGATKIPGAVSASVLGSEIEQLLARMETDRR